MPRSCPPGVWCFSGGLALTFLVTGIVLLLLMYQLFKMPPVMMPPAPPVTVINRGGDSRYDRAPEPTRDWDVSLPINIPTQGFPESFQSVGIIQAGDQILPLYGRRTLRGGDRWNYYTRTDTYNPVPLPIQFQKRDCMDDVGCQEILSGEPVRIDALHKEGKTSIYRFDGPKYIPGLL
jgi:hypothetical protein